jgi:hypothetical protein
VLERNSTSADLRLVSDLSDVIATITEITVYKRIVNVDRKKPIVYKVVLLPLKKDVRMKYLEKELK